MIEIDISLNRYLDLEKKNVSVHLSVVLFLLTLLPNFNGNKNKNDSNITIKNESFSLSHNAQCCNLKHLTHSNYSNLRLQGYVELCVSCYIRCTDMLV